HVVSMPWQSLGMPSLAMALVRGILASTDPDITVTEHFCNLAFAEFVTKRSGGRITPRHYQDVADHGIALGLGDWVFAGALYYPGWREAEMLRFAADRGASIGMAPEMRALAAEFIETVAAGITAAGADAVGFTTTFMQNVPSLALARRIKELAPSTVIVFGGANCDGPMGAALHRNHPFIDYVVRGEAELVLPQLATRILQGSAGAAGIDGVCWWQDGTSVANPQLEPAVPAALIQSPDYAAWHAAFTASPLREYVAPCLVVEGSRGCWWGQKHHCTFCGLNGSTIGYRGRPAERLLHEIERLAADYGVLDIVTADNIMDPAFYRELLPQLAANGWDLRIHFELKANVSEEQIGQLAAAGIIMVQFGIESFSSRVLGLMGKGLAGATAVRVLRDAQDHGISVAWNYLYGFPGERDEDYLRVIGQIPALAHLQPCLQAGTRIELTRFSPLFEDPRLGFPDRRPAGFYPYVYDLPDAELRDLAYFWDCPDAGIAGDVEDRLSQALAAWIRKFPASYLHMAADDGAALVLADRREGWPRRDIELAGWQRAAYLALRRPRSAASLQAALAETDTIVTGHDLRPMLDGLLGQGLVFRDDSDPPRYVALATRRVHAKLAG
ncbi:MAG: RiPP maturation radical SAM C-methyltransferase, partial [Streptosporangiaceae bacterium]